MACPQGHSGGRSLPVLPGCPPGLASLENPCWTPQVGRSTRGGPSVRWRVHGQIARPSPHPRALGPRVVLSQAAPQTLAEAAWTQWLSRGDHAMAQAEPLGAVLTPEPVCVGGVAVTGACQDRAGIVTRVPLVMAGCGSCPWRRKATLSAPFPQQQEAPPHPAQPESHQVPGSPCWLYQAAPRAGIACGCATGFTRKPRPSGVPSCPHPTHGRSLVPRRSGEPDCRGGILVPCPPVSPFPLHPRASAWGGTLRPPHTQGLCC